MRRRDYLDAGDGRGNGGGGIAESMHALCQARGPVMDWSAEALKRQPQNNDSWRMPKPTVSSTRARACASEPSAPE